MPLTVLDYAPFRLLGASDVDYPSVGFPGDPGTMTSADYPDTSSPFDVTREVLGYQQATAYPIGMPLGVLLALYYAKYITIQGSLATNSDDPGNEYEPSNVLAYGAAAMAEQNFYTASSTSGSGIYLSTATKQQRGPGGIINPFYLGNTTPVYTASRVQTSAILTPLIASAGVVATATATEGSDPPTTSAELCAVNLGIFANGQEPGDSIIPYVLKDKTSGLYFPPFVLFVVGESAFGVGTGVTATPNYCVPSNLAGTTGSFDVGTLTLKVGGWQATAPIYATVPSSTSDGEGDAISYSGAINLTVTAYPDTSPP